MVVNSKRLNLQYNEQGYCVVKQYLSLNEIESLREVILTFHDLWKEDNASFYKEEAFNSSLITGSEYLKSTDRIKLFNFISSTKLLSLVRAVLSGQPAFMNTQLFFNPVNPNLKDFWHRDCQYDHDIESQKRVIAETQVLHLRVPLFDELGMELVPGTHKRWDNEEEFAVRHEENGKLSSDDLKNTVKIPLAAGDILLFSADMIHRGLYGLDRLALDILIFDSSADYIDYVDADCLPDSSMLAKIDNPQLFMNTLKLISNR